MVRQFLGMAALVALAACGTNPQERTTGGAATGAATGATIGLVGGPVGVLAGAAIGAGAGAVTGATTSPRDINLGRPPWNNPEVRTPMDRNRRTAQNSRTRQRAVSEEDRAYNGGGMVGYPDASRGTTTGGNPPPMGGSTGGPMMNRDATLPPSTGMAPRNDGMTPMNDTAPGMGRTGR